jgi:hypothetical protein
VPPRPVTFSQTWFYTSRCETYSVYLTLNYSCCPDLKAFRLIFHREKYGLYHVNFSDPKRQRKPKSSAYIFSEINRKRELPRYFLDITGEYSEVLPPEIMKDLTIQLSNSSSSHHSATSWGWKFLLYSRDLLIVFLAIVVSSSYIFKFR